MECQALLLGSGCLFGDVGLLLHQIATWPCRHGSDHINCQENVSTLQTLEKWKVFIFKCTSPWLLQSCNPVIARMVMGHRFWMNPYLPATVHCWLHYLLSGWGYLRTHHLWKSRFRCTKNKLWMQTTTNTKGLQYLTQDKELLKLSLLARTGLVLRCTDEGWGHPRHCDGLPTSLQMLCDTEAGRLPSWRTAPWDCVPHSQIWQWPQSVPLLKETNKKVSMKKRDTTRQTALCKLYLIALFSVANPSNRHVSFISTLLLVYVGCKNTNWSTYYVF